METHLQELEGEICKSVVGCITFMTRNVGGVIEGGHSRERYKHVYVGVTYMWSLSLL